MVLTPTRRTGIRSGLQRVLRGLLVGVLLTGSAVVGAPAAPASAELTQCAPEKEVPGMIGYEPDYIVATWCSLIRTNTILGTILSRTYQNTSSAEASYEATVEMERKVEVQGGFDAGVISASLTGGLTGKESQKVSFTLKPEGEAALNVYAKGTYYEGHQYRFPKGDRYCAFHPLSFCTRSNFTVKRYEFMDISTSKFEPKLAIQFGMTGPDMIPLTMNANLAGGTYDARNIFNQKEVGSLYMTSPSRLERYAKLTTGAIRDTEFYVSYNDTGAPVSVRYRYVWHLPDKVLSSAWTTTFQVIGF